MYIDDVAVTWRRTVAREESQLATMAGGTGDPPDLGRNDEAHDDD